LGYSPLKSVDMWMHQRRGLSWFLLCFLAEVASSWTVWRSSPYDTLRAGYTGFAKFEAGRLQFWTLMLVMIGLIGLAMTWLAKRDNRLSGSKENAKTKRLWLRSSLYLASAIALEIGASVLYWYWSRARRPEEFGWPIFRFYLWEHLLPWAVVISLGLFLWSRLAIKWTETKGRLALFVMSVGLTLVAVVFMAEPHCVCFPCLFVDPSTMKPLDQGNHCHCTSYASQLYESAFGHNERHSETMSKSTRPCEAKSGTH
jgi:hypothetical protein